MDTTAEPELPRGIALAWGLAASPQRGPKREMSVERIVEAAVELADADGLGAVSMAAVAARLGYTPMSLYRYVTAKDDLLLLMQEEATGVPAESSVEPGNWRARLTEIYAEQLQIYLRHPWMLDIPITGSPITPNSAAWMDAGLAALADTGLPHIERLAIMTSVTGQSRWAGSVISGYLRAQRDAGIEGEELARSEDALFRALITGDGFPHLWAAVEAGVFVDETDTFSLGYSLFLDGVERHLATRASDPSAPAIAAGTFAEFGDEPDDAEISGDKKLREARKAVRDAEKALRDARKLERQATREARARVARRGA